MFTEYEANKVSSRVSSVKRGVVDFGKLFTVTIEQKCSHSRAYFNVPTGTGVLGDLKSVLEGLVTRA